MYYETDVQLNGFYGTKTKEHYLNKKSLGEERKERKEMERRANLAKTQALSSVPEEDELREEPEESKSSRLKRVFSRRSTVG